MRVRQLGTDDRPARRRAGDGAGRGRPGPAVCRPGMGDPGPSGRFGAFGGRYVPESLVPACQELEAAFRAAWSDQEFRSRYAALLRDYAGRPTPVTECGRLSDELGVRVLLEAGRPHPHRLAQDQQRPRPGPADGPDGQAAPGGRDRRRPARRGDGDRGGAVRSRVRGLHGRDRYRAAGAQRLPDAAARRRGPARHLGQPDAQGRRQRGAPRLGGHASRPPTTAWAR